MVFRLAILQQSSAGRHQERNLAILLARMQEAASREADLLLIPECFLTGYELPIPLEEAITEKSPAVEKICSTAREWGIGVVLTALTRGEKGLKNSAWIIDRSGSILMQYDKVHTCDFADEICLESGKEFKVCNFHGVKLGVMICYDREYPESARMLMLKGAEIILVPNDCESMKPRVQALSTRAYENMTGVAMANPPGENAGCSCTFSPICWDQQGKCVENTLLLAGESEEGLFLADFDLDRIRQYRQQEMMGNTFRKVRAYEGLTDSEIQPPFLRENQNRS